jgi:O-Antigen ligase
MSGAHASVVPVETGPYDAIPTLSSDLVRLLLWSTAFGAAALATRSAALVVGVLAVLYLVVTVARGFGATLLGFLLVLAPDALVVSHVGSLPVTLKLATYGLAFLLVLLGLLSRTVTLSVPSVGGLLVLTLAGIVGAAQTGRVRSLPEFFVLVISPALVGAAMGATGARERRFVRGLVVGAVVTCVLAMVEYVRGHNFLVTSSALGSFQREGTVRANAGWDYPTYLAAFVCLVAFLMIDAFRRRWGLLGAGVGAALALLAVVATQSRSGLLGLAVGGAVYLLVQSGLANRAKVAVGVVIGGSAVFLASGKATGKLQTFVDQSLTQGTEANANVAYRQQLYHDARGAVTEHPWFGYGFGSGKSVATNELQAFFGDHTDLASLPVSMAVQLGLVGLVAAAWVVVRCWAAGFRAGGAARTSYCAGIAAGLGALSGVPLDSPCYWLFLLCGLAWGRSRRGPAPEPARVDEPETSVPSAAGAWVPQR